MFFDKIKASEFFQGLLLLNDIMECDTGHRLWEGDEVLLNLVYKIKTMKERITTGWNLQRIILVLTGLGLVVYSISTGTWTGILLGAYFAAMGIFRFGCAAGNCYGGSCDADTPAYENKTQYEVQYEEVK